MGKNQIFSKSEIKEAALNGLGININREETDAILSEIVSESSCFSEQEKDSFVSYLVDAFFLKIDSNYA